MVGNGNCASKKELLQSINQVSFAIDDLLLFLDTHPREKRALEYFSELSARRNELLKKYAELHGPLSKRQLPQILAVDGTAVSMGTGRRMQISYVEL